MLAQTIELKPLAPTLTDYDTVAIAFSGGKDSVAAVLSLINDGVPKSKMILLHHDIDGEDSTLMDWPCTKGYCQAFAEALGIQIYFSWKVGGFEGEMLRENALTKPVTFECSTGELITRGGTTGKKNTRLKFPQVAADLRTRWCSAYLKVDVGTKVLIHDPLFSKGKILFVTGERAQESSSRAKYLAFEPHASSAKKIKVKDNNGDETGKITFKRSNKRHIDHWRPVHAWSEEQVWSELKKHKILPHPAYFLGWGRTSCLACIFGSANQWATIRKFMPERFNRIARYEESFGTTIHRKLTVKALADKGVPYTCSQNWLDLAMDYTFNPNILVDVWVLPSGAFGESNGPT